MKSNFRAVSRLHGMAAATSAWNNDLKNDSNRNGIVTIQQPFKKSLKQLHGFFNHSPDRNEICLTAWILGWRENRMLTGQETPAGEKPT
ncbi:MAG: hypothetical protein H7833_02425 [Magnetococcus sp. DMHC-1]|nr:hypothetical protein [Magnetococcales bacterium]